MKKSLKYSLALLFIIVAISMLSSCDKCNHIGGKANCTEFGTCSLCGEIYLLPHGHKQNEPTDTECSVCGEEFSLGLEYELLENDTYSVKGVGNGGKKIVIPQYHNNKLVTSISGSAFYYCEFIESVAIPNTVTSIGDWAFGSCTNISEIVIPDSVTYIGADAFINCEKLTCIVIPDNVKSIAKNTFSGCKNISFLKIPDSVETIKYFAFGGCESLASITISDKVSCIEEEAFALCYGLTSITVDENNDFYKSIDGNLYTKDEKTLIQYSLANNNDSFTVPDGVTRIANRAFDGCTNIKTVLMSDSVTSVGDRAFRNCTSLANIIFSNNITEIGGYAFESCTNLTKITFNGTVEQWQLIEKGDYWNYHVPATEIVCTDGTVTLE